MGVQDKRFNSRMTNQALLEFTSSNYGCATFFLIKVIIPGTEKSSIGLRRKIVNVPNPFPLHELPEARDTSINYFLRDLFPLVFDEMFWPKLLNLEGKLYPE